MSVWTFCDFRTGTRNLVRDWLSGLPQGVGVRVKAALNALLLELELVSGPFDRQHGVGQLRGVQCKGLYELILKVANTQFRVIGFYGPALQEFTLLCGAVEKDGVLDPPTTCMIAQQRRSLASKDRRFVRVHEYD
jgi:hypothetical protein